MGSVDHSSIGFLQDSQTVLVIEDENDVETLFRKAIRAEIPYHFLFVKDAAKALNVLQSVLPHFLILDSALPLEPFESYFRSYRNLGEFLHTLD